MKEISSDFRTNDSSAKEEKDYYRLAVSSSLKSPIRTYHTSMVELDGAMAEFIKGKGSIVIAERQGVLRARFAVPDYDYKGEDFTFTGIQLATGKEIIKVMMHLGLDLPKDDILFYFPSVEKVIKCWELPLPEKDLTVHDILVQFANNHSHIPQDQLFEDAFMLKGMYLNMKGEEEDF